jgi:protease-4
MEGAYSTDVRKALEDAAADASIKAVVLRVDSPGGSAVASEIILDATKRLKAKKAFVVSMGAVAGSGGYYVSCGADTLFADPTTITGSIGVVSGKMATTAMWSQIGVTWKRNARGRQAIFSPSERQAMQAMMDDVYAVFKGHVTAARGNRLKKPIDEIAGGRVYSGRQALELGLIDKLGSLDDAIRFVAAQAKLAQYDVRTVPKPKSFFEVLLEDLGDQRKDEDRVSSLDAQMAKRHSRTLLDAAMPYLGGVESDRLRSIRRALGQLEALQEQRVLLAMPEMLVVEPR